MCMQQVTAAVRETNTWYAAGVSHKVVTTMPVHGSMPSFRFFNASQFNSPKFYGS